MTLPPLSGLSSTSPKAPSFPRMFPTMGLTRRGRRHGVQVEGFLQTYLGLPLSCEKLSLDAFAPPPTSPKMTSTARAGEPCSSRLPAASSLVNVVLESLPTHAIAAMQLPPAIIKMFDGLRRTFLWDEGDRISGQVPGGMGRGLPLQGRGRPRCSCPLSKTRAS
jgi:hypothetical protein